MGASVNHSWAIAAVDKVEQHDTITCMGTKKPIAKPKPRQTSNPDRPKVSLFLSKPTLVKVKRLCKKRGVKMTRLLEQFVDDAVKAA